MVLSHNARGRALGMAILMASAAFGAAPADAQSSTDSDSQLFDLAPEYRPIGLKLGNATLYPQLNLLAEHDSNIYAEPVNEKDDRILYFIPRLRADLDKGTWQFRGLAQAQVRRFVKNEFRKQHLGNS